VYKSIRPDGMLPKGVQELADKVANLLSIIFEKSWLSGEVSSDYKKGNITPMYNKRKKGRSRQLQVGEPHIYA